jgi:hypothetical protein
MHCCIQRTAEIAVPVLMSQWFAPTKFVISFERDGIGRFSDSDLEEIVVTGDAGRVTLNFPNKFILISNHQVRRLLSCSFRFLSDVYRCTPIGGINGL